MLSLQKKLFFSLFSLQGWTRGNRFKIWSFGWTYFLNDPSQSLFAATKIYILIFNLTYYLINLMGSFHFPLWKMFFQIHWQILKIFGNGISQSFTLSLKCDHPLLCEFSILFSTVKLKLGHKFSQITHRFNIGILKCWSGAVYIPKFFPIHKRDGKLECLKSLDCISKFPQFTEKFENWDYCPLTFIFAQRWDWGCSFSTMTCGVREEPI